jgi:hypothetical protein
MDGTRLRQDERIPQWARWVALVLAISWAVNWAVNLARGEGGRDLWWPLVSTVIWAGLTAYGFRTYRRIRTTTLPAVTGRPPA